jgi:hypothetical protein
MNFKHESPRKSDESQQKLLEPADFCDLLLSRRQLDRFQSVEGVLGLLDRHTDERFQVEESTLDRYAERLARDAGLYAMLLPS